MGKTDGCMVKQQVIPCFPGKVYFINSANTVHLFGFGTQLVPIIMCFVWDSQPLASCLTFFFFFFEYNHQQNCIEMMFQLFTALVIIVMPTEICNIFIDVKVYVFILQKTERQMDKEDMKIMFIIKACQINQSFFSCP